MKITQWLLLKLGLLLALLTVALLANAQTIGKMEKDRGRYMLDLIKTDLKKNYYDTSFRGIDIEARFKAAEEKIEQANSNGHIFGIIAQALTELDDSHTFFLPPQRANRTEYGWQLLAVGDHCYVNAVKPGSDAEMKGLKVGDEILSIDGRELDRSILWKLKYLYYTLRPQPGMRLVVQSPNEKPRQLDVMAKIVQGHGLYNLNSGVDFMILIRESENEPRLKRHRYLEMGDEVFIWKMPLFDLSDNEVDVMMDKVRKRKALLLDLRGNGGGAVDTLKRLVGSVCDKDVKIADLKGRKEMKPMIAKSRGDKAFTGKIVVLVDSESGSASELFARVMQLEKRGIVIGDRTAGAVMQAKYYDHTSGLDTVSFYGVSITDADLIMADGKSLEHMGVTPDELLLPTAMDMAKKQDLVMSRAAALIGLKLEPEKAGAMFPIEWKK